LIIRGMARVYVQHASVGKYSSGVRPDLLGKTQSIISMPRFPHCANTHQVCQRPSNNAVFVWALIWRKIKSDSYKHGLLSLTHGQPANYRVALKLRCLATRLQIACADFVKSA
jgi:hypothetical protein